MRIFCIHGARVVETDALPPRLPEQGFVWIACARAEFEQGLAALQASLQALVGTALLDLHVSDLLNPQLPSRFDDTSLYDIMVFRRLASGQGGSEPHLPLSQVPRRSGPPVLRRIDTSPVGFAVFDRLLLTVHPADCAVRDAYAARLLNATEARTSGTALPELRPDARSTGARGIPTGPADLMLRLINQMVDSYLELRRELTRQLDHWQAELLHPATHFHNWGALLDARLSLHQLDEICEDQRAAVQNWIDALASWPEVDTPAEQRERELLRVRSRDVLEHIERVVHHVRRLEHSAETAVQMHFSLQSNRTNDIMRMLTVLTAIFLPLNLIAGIFGMNFEFIPLLHRQSGFWWAMGAMGTIATAMGLLFWRKRYLARSGR